MEKTKSDKLFGDTFAHPSFGQITFVNCQGGAQPLFGSSILHRNTIRMEICRAEYNRNNARDWIFGREPLIQAYLSHTQFADAITGVGSRHGAPITLSYVKGEGDIERPPFVNKREQFENEFTQTTNDIIERLDDLEAKVNERKLPKWVSHEIGVIRSWLRDNHPFMAEQFDKQMDDSITEAKGEIEGYLSSVVNQLGIEAIKQSAPELPTGKSSEIGDGQ